MTTKDSKIENDQEYIITFLDDWVADVVYLHGDDCPQVKRAKQEAEEIKQHMRTHPPEETWWCDEDGFIHSPRGEEVRWIFEGIVFPGEEEEEEAEEEDETDDEERSRPEGSPCDDDRQLH